jgi:CBS domain-containing protein/gamma-glutamyl:cysteine ligase YbdK (ATP-grasp superfamily)
MGEHDVSEPQDQAASQAFMKNLLDEVRVFERMLEKPDLFESGVRRIGAEQEMFLIDSSCRPANLSGSMLKLLTDPRFTTELAQFNLEANLSPQVLGGSCLRRMEDECRELVNRAREAAREQGGEVLLTGILPTILQSDLSLENMTPNPRYRALNDAVIGLKGGEVHILIKGVDELDIRHDNVMLEAVNTSFQVHFQVHPKEFANLYNLAQVVTAPVLAAAVNSPTLMGRRLWKETRIAVFQHSVDARSVAHQARGNRPRVHFGDDWIQESVLEIIKEDIARFRVMLTTEIDETAVEEFNAGKAPCFKALRLHNGTVYRWNRACYGVNDGVAHLRIENRVLPSGPTILDEVANAAFFFGLLSGLSHDISDVRKRMKFADAKSNFLSAARRGLKAQFAWFDGRNYSAQELVLKELLPEARRGLLEVDIDPEDVDRYLNVIEERVRRGATGADWALRSLEAMGDKGTADQRMKALSRGQLRMQLEEKPVGTWEPVDLEDAPDWRESYQTVGQFMTTDLFTVQPGDLVDFAASLMDWEHIRHVPVEDNQGKLVGLVSHRALLRLVAEGKGSEFEPVAVSSIMRTDPLTVEPGTKTLEAIRLMQDRRVGCLPVVEDGKLVGIVTERDLVFVAAKLVEEQLKNS